ncbi:MAG: AmmeMemoRadiSam system protein A [Nitrospinae bacterium]|nr:AmmeMemoRadiSam system protein A [Nitrospinota bacterium]
MNGFALSGDGQRALLTIAREAIRAAARGEVYRPPEPAPDELERRHGVFVSLHKGGELRGCIGYITAQDPLYLQVARAARSAAMDDSRFPPVAPEEVESLDIEISVLSVPIPVSCADDIELGRHGIIVSLEGRRALFLPQVAPAQGWDKKTTLQCLCLKAGLKPDDWKSEAGLSVFEAFVFGEV